MSGQTTASEQVTALMNDWYVYMRAQDTEKSDELKQQTDQEVEQFQQDANLLILYSLMQFRHSILKRNFDKAASQLEQLTPLKNEMDHQLSYYYYFFKGIYAYGEKRYDEAIKNYQIAEKLLGIIQPDPVERAEFHYKMGQAYFYLDYLTLSVEHGQRALDIFESQGNSEKRCATCKVLLGQSYKDSEQFDHALFYYEEAFNQSQNLNDQTLINIINENLGELYSQQGKLQEAIGYFKLSLSDNNRTDYRLSTMYVLSNECFKVNKRVEAEHWLNKAYDLAQSSNDVVFLHRLKILKANYLKSEKIEESLVDALNYFQKEKLWDHVETYSKKLADYYYRKDQFKMAASYYRVMLKASKYTSIRGRK